MKILFDNCNFSSRSGPNSFAHRLANEFVMMGHIIADPRDYDIALVFIEPTQKTFTKTIVQRLDGIWFKPEEFHTKNVRIKSCYEQASHVIWQSDFDRGMITKWWGPSVGTVIHNGIKIEPILNKNHVSPELLNLRAEHEKLFVTSSNWHPQKRLKSNIDAFLHLKNSFYPTAGLIVLGSNPDHFVANPNIFYAGNVPHEICMQVYALSDWMLHLAYIDHCPNVVIECMMQGTPVICAESGGTKEIVGDFGIIVPETHSYNYELVDYDEPPFIDVTTLGDLPHVNELGKHTDIDINNVAKKYIKVFESLI